MHLRFGRASLIGLFSASGPNLPPDIILCLKVYAPNILISSSSLFYVAPTSPSHLMYLECTLDLRVSLTCILSFRKKSITSDWRELDWRHLLLKRFVATTCDCRLLSLSHYRLLVPTTDKVIPLIVVSLSKVTAGARLYLRATTPHTTVLSTPAHHCCSARIS